MTSPALVLILGLIIFKWAVRGTNVAPTGALILACEKNTVSWIPIILSNNILIISRRPFPEYQYSFPMKNHLVVRHTREGKGYVADLVTSDLLVFFGVDYQYLVVLISPAGACLLILQYRVFMITMGIFNRSLIIFGNTCTFWEPVEPSQWIFSSFFCLEQLLHHPTLPTWKSDQSHKLCFTTIFLTLAAWGQYS